MLIRHSVGALRIAKVMNNGNLKLCRDVKHCETKQQLMQFQFATLLTVLSTTKRHIFPEGGVAVVVLFATLLATLRAGNVQRLSMET